MYGAVMIAATGLQSQQHRIDTIADNVANINTGSYKSSRLEFKDALYTSGLGTAKTPDGNQQKGHGTMVAAITRDFSSGSLIETEKELDVALMGDGFFALDDGKGNILYTRSGEFTLSNNADSDTFYLVNASGYYVLNENDERIEIPADTAKIEFGEDGTICFRDGAGEEISQAKLGLFSFDNLMGLESAGSGNYTAGASSGGRFAAKETTVVQGSLEGSNVNLATEMTNLIRTQRIFSLASKALTTADDMEGIANNLRK